ncbi:MAG: portal protein [Candidatus Pacebacteria bacterium]|nr:portal protein [Candidatus Paceibacterota bacterium]
MAELFGFTIQRSSKERDGEKTFSIPTPDDGTVDVVGGGFFGQILDTDGRERSDLDLIKRYRDIAQQAECDTAIEDIVNEGIVSNQNDQAIEISLDRLHYPDKIKRKIRTEFDEVLRLLNFEQKGHDIFRRWYVDGRIFYHKVIDTKNPRKGITELRYIDATKIKKVREVQTKIDSKHQGVEVAEKIDEYFVYNEKGLTGPGGIGSNQGIKIAPDAITYVPSGLIEGNGGRVLSYLHKAIKPVNQLRMIEDALVIYRISRAPERRIFYIDVGNLPKIKAEQYLKDVMNRYRNKLVYDANTGEIRDDRNHMSMLEDFWLPRREGGRGTEITTLPGGSNLGEIDDIQYFRTKLYRSLNVPISRLEAESGFSLGRSTEITRDELKFTKFVQRIRKKFSPIFTDILKTQLLLKGIIAPEDWSKIQEHIQYDYLADGHFAELKDAELLENRLNQLQTVEAYIGTFFSKEYVLKKVLRMNDTEIQEMRDQIKKEMDTDPMDGGIVVPPGGDGIHRVPVGPDGMPMDPADSASDRADKAMGIDPDAEEAPPPEEPVEAETDPAFIVKKRKR